MRFLSSKEEVSIQIKDETITTDNAYIMYENSEGELRSLYVAEDYEFLENFIGNSLVNSLEIVYKLLGEEDMQLVIDQIQGILNDIRGGEIDPRENNAT